MPRCVAASCSNNHFDSVSFHKFPKSVEIRKLWTAAVSRTRLNFSPSDYSCLCSSHFKEEDFEVRFSLSVELGVSGKHNRTLKKGAISSIFPKPATPGNLPQNPAKKRRSGAYEKRERARVVKDILVASSSTTGQCVDVNDEAMIIDETTETTRMCSIAVQTDAYDEHCACCREKVRKTMESSPFQFVPKMVDKGMQIFAAEHLCHSTAPQMCEEATEDSNDNENDSDSDDSEGSDDSDEEEEEEEEKEEMDTDDLNDPDYNPLDSDDDIEEDENNYIEDDIYKRRKFIVFEKQLLHAFNVCPVCSSPTERKVSAVIGTFCRIHQFCPTCNNSRYWESQPFIENVPAGNLLLSASILFAGCCISKILLMLKHMRCAAITSRTFSLHQKTFLLPAVHALWSREREIRISELEGDVILGGDGRADSPGHSAKYGCYTLMNLRSGKIVHVEVVQSNEVGNAQRMEKEGLIRSVKKLKEDKVKIDVLVTDRHVSIKKWVHERHQTQV